MNIALFSDENNTATHQSSNASYSDSVALWNADKDVMPPRSCAQDWKKTLSDFTHIFTGFVCFDFLFLFTFDRNENLDKSQNLLQIISELGTLHGYTYNLT